MRINVMAGPAMPPHSIPPGQPLPKVYVVPIKGEIDASQLYLLRRALKEAVENKVDTVILDLNSSGGRMDVALEMMEAIAKFSVESRSTYALVNDQAMAAGSFIAMAATEIYFKPGTARIGEAAAEAPGGAELDAATRRALSGFFGGAVRELAKGERYRGPVLQAMMDSDLELKVDNEVIKPKGKRLALTGEEACRPFGYPRQKLLGAGLAPDADALARQLLGEGNYALKNFERTWPETVARGINAIAPLLLGAGILLLLMEFRSPGFGLPGLAGIGVLLIFFVGQYAAGLTGGGPVLLFGIGIGLFALELLFFSGSMLCAILGLFCFLGSIIWAMTDVWPGETFGGVTFSALGWPLLKAGLALLMAIGGFLLLRCLRPKVAGAEGDGQPDEKGGRAVPAQEIGQAEVPGGE